MKNRYKVNIFLFTMIALALFTSSITAQAKKSDKVKKISLSKKAVIKLSKGSYTYNGKKHKPKVTVKVNKKKLKKNKNYKIKYKNNKKVGKATVIIKAYNKNKKAKKIYVGSKKKTFIIKRAARTITFGKKAYTAVEGDGKFTITAKLSKGTSQIKFKSTNTKVVKIGKTSGQVTVVGAGTAQIVASVGTGKYYKAASAKVKITVSKKPKIVIDSEKSIREFNYENDKNRATYANYYAKGLVTYLKDLTSWKVLNKYTIPGLVPTADEDLLEGKIECNNLVPQGICCAGDYMITTAYCFDENHGSCLFVYDRESGEFLQTLILSKTSHVGGLTYDTKHKNLWLAYSSSSGQDNEIQMITYEQFKSYVKSTKKYLKLADLGEKHTVSNKPSVIAYDENSGYLWVATWTNIGIPSKMYAYEYVAGQETEKGYMKGELVHVKEVTGLTPDQSYMGFEAMDTDESQVAIKNIEDGKIATIATESGNISLQVNDQIIKIDGQDIERLEDIYNLFEDKDRLLIEGRKVGITILRDEETISGTITLASGGSNLYKDIKDRVQGLAFTKDGHIIFSRSYCRNTMLDEYVSDLIIYDGIEWDSANRDWKNWDDTAIIVLPPMVEAIILDSDNGLGNIVLDMIFESSAPNYYKGLDNNGNGESEAPIDRIIQLSLSLSTL